jgi:DNA-binding transcriptional regulator YiaG
MSMNSESRARLERLGPIRDGSRDPSFSSEVEPVLLRRIGGFSRRIDVAQRLRASGLGLKAAHIAISELAEQDWTLCDIPIDGGIDALARDLLPLDVTLQRRRTFPEPAAFIAEVRARHKLSQREFAAALGLDVRTLQNWEQGRNRPDAAVLSLVALFDRDPALVREIAFAPAG